jgi:hypothetical protein
VRLSHRAASGFNRRLRSCCGANAV